jgi:ATP-dependent helicase/DNAse subunit B
MKEGTLLVAPPGAGHKKEQLFEEVIRNCPVNDFSSALFVGPNNFVLSTARNQFYSFLKKSSGQRAYIPFKTATIKQLASDLHEKYGEKNTVSDHIKTLVLCEILKDKNIGYARILSDLSTKIRHYIPDKDLRQVKEDVKNLIFEEKAVERAENALDVLCLYEKELHSKNILDPDDMLRSSLPLIRDHISPPLLVIDGFHDPTGLEMKIIRELIEKSERVYILAEEGTEILEYVQSLKLNIILRKLEHSSPRRKRGYYSYPSMEDEIEGIAKNIKSLILNGVPPWEIILCFPVLTKYLPMTGRIFKRHDIPVSIGELNLSTTGPFVALGEMITCIEEDYPRNDFLSLLTSPSFPLVPTAVKTKAVSYSYRAGIVKGKNAWLSIKNILLNSVGTDLQENEKKDLNEFQKELGHIINIIDTLKEHKSLLPFMDDFEASLDKLGFFESPAISQSAVYGDRIAEAIKKQFSALRLFASLYDRGYGHAETPAFYVRYALQGIKGSAENRDGVKILPFELAAGFGPRALFLGGMLEGEFPSRPDIDPILPEKVKKSLGIPHLEYYLKRQRGYFRRLLNVSVNEPWFSCPSAEGDKIFLPSPFLDWGDSINPPDLNIFTEEDVQIRSGGVRQTGAQGIVFWEENMFPSKTSLSILQKRISTIFKGSISVTSLDYYRKCPLRFYIEKVLNLEVERPPKFEVESRLWGTLAHKTMEHLFKDGDIELAHMDREIANGLDRSLKQFPIGHFWSRVAREIFQKLLPLLKEQETEIRIQGFSPSLVEKSIKAEINGLKLKGKIDRIDKKARRTESTTESPVILLDYKTGSIDRASLQMPLYAAMWRKVFSETVEKTGYYSLKEGQVHWFPKKSGMEEYIQQALKEAEDHVINIKKGRFPALPVKDTECRYCDHSPLCNKEISNR